jgi:hypothetical protein
MRKKVGPVAIVIAVVAVLVYIGILYQATMVKHVPKNPVGAREKAAEPAMRDQIQALMKQKYGTPAPETPDTTVGRKSHHRIGD